MPILMDTSQRLPWAHVPRSRDFQKLSMSLSAHPCGRLQAPRGAFEFRFRATTLVFSGPTGTIETYKKNLLKLVIFKNLLASPPSSST